MALLVWQDDLNIGIDVIDQQHRRIIEMLNHRTWPRPACSARQWAK